MTDRSELIRRMRELSPERRTALLKGRPSSPPTAEPVASSPRYREDRNSPFPLGLDQERLWLLHMQDPKAHTYNLSVGLNIEGRLDAGAFRRAVKRLLVRHESLRSRITFEANGPVLVVDAESVPSLDEFDWNGIAATEIEARMRDWVAHAFDLERGPIFRLMLAKTGEAEWRVVESIHHSFGDQWSYIRLNRDLLELYRSEMTGAPARLPELPYQYGDFAAWQRELFSGDVAAKARRFWSGFLQGAPDLLLPFRRERADLEDRAGAHHYFLLDDAVAASALQTARQLHVTPTTYLLAAYVATLYEFTGQRDLTIGLPSATRQAPGTADLVGFLLTTIPVRVILPDRPTNLDVIEACRRATLLVSDHLQTPFKEIVAAVAPARDSTSYPLAQAMFMVLDFDDTIFELPNMRVIGSEVDDRVSPMDLTLSWWRAGDRLHGRFEYRTSLFPSTAVDAIAQSLLMHVKDLSENPARLLRAGASAASARQPAEGSIATLPTTRGGQALLGALRSLFPTAIVDPSESFFRYGSSLDAFRLIQVLGSQGFRVALSDVFDAPSLAVLGSQISDEEYVEEHEEHAGPNVASAQQASLLIWQSANLGREWVHSIALELPQRATRNDIQSAIDELIAGHPTLSSRFWPYNSGGSPTWLWSGGKRVVVESSDTEDLSVVVQAHRSTLSASKGDTFAATLVGHSHLVLTGHHLVTDGVSWDIVVDELARALGGAARLDPENGYQRYCEWLRQQQFEAEVPYWTRQLVGVPSGAPKGVGQATDREVSVELGSNELWSGPMLEAVSLAGVLQALDTVRSREPITMISAGRRGLEPVLGRSYSRAVGYFSTEFPMSFASVANPSQPQSVSRIRQLLNEVPGDGIGYSALRASAHYPASALGSLPSPRISFNYMGQLRSALGEHGIRLVREYGAKEAGATDEFDLSVEARTENDLLHILLAAPAASRFCALIPRMAESCQNAAAELVASFATHTERAVPGRTGLSSAEVQQRFDELTDERRER